MSDRANTRAEGTPCDEGAPVDAQAARDLARVVRNALYKSPLTHVSRDPAEAALAELVARLEAAEREREGYKRDFLAASERRAWADTRIATLTHALETVRREVDLPEYIAEFVGDALAALAATDQDAEVRDLVYRLGHWHLSDDERSEYEARLKELRSFPVASTTLTPSERSLRKSWGPERMRHDPER